MAARGREAARPTRIPLRGWRDLLLRVRAQVASDNVGIVSAGVAFYLLLAIFPALAALVSLYGLVADPAEVSSQLGRLQALPQQAKEVLMDQLQRISATSNSALGWGVALSVLLSVLSAMKGVKALVQGANIAYGERDERGFFARNALAFALTLGAVALGALAIAIMVAVPALLGRLALGPVLEALVAVLPWLLLAAAFTGSLAVLYRYGPDRRRAQWRWVTPGSVLATVLWLAGSVAFSFYVSQFGNYNETYGSVGAVVVLLLWLSLTAYAVLLGAELDAEMEHQTRRDTTVGRERPPGRRGAAMADDLGELPEGSR